MLEGSFGGWLSNKKVKRGKSIWDGEKWQDAVNKTPLGFEGLPRPAHMNENMLSKLEPPPRGIASLFFLMEHLLFQFLAIS